MSNALKLLLGQRELSETSVETPACLCARKMRFTTASRGLLISCAMVAERRAAAASFSVLRSTSCALRSAVASRKTSTTPRVAAVVTDGRGAVFNGDQACRRGGGDGVVGEADDACRLHDLRAGFGGLAGVLVVDGEAVGDGACSARQPRSGAAE